MKVAIRCLLSCCFGALVAAPAFAGGRPLPATLNAPGPHKPKPEVEPHLTTAVVAPASGSEVPTLGRQPRGLTPRGTAPLVDKGATLPTQGGGGICTDAEGDCCVGNGSPGCDDPDCCEAVCDQDPFCCGVEWDLLCAGEAEQLCCKLCGAAVCGNGVLECDEECDDGNTDDGDCCSSTCTLDTVDTPCGDPSDTECDNPDTCDGLGTCLDNHKPDGWECSDDDPCTTDVCQGGVCEHDPIEPCCDDGDCGAAENCCSCEEDCGPCSCGDGTCDEPCENWENCEADCTVCGVPGAGNCCGPNGSPGCDDFFCCSLVCDDDPFCCSNEWDDMCALYAEEYCGDLCARIVGSDPPDTAIDAGKPTDIDECGTEYGWDEITLEFDRDASGVGAGDFTIPVDPAHPSPPTICNVLHPSANVVRLMLCSRIPVGHWTIFTHDPSGISTRLGYLPADVNGDGTSRPVDILDLIDHINEVIILPTWGTDVDRSGVTNPADILTVIDLLNGAMCFDPGWNGESLP